MPTFYFRFCWHTTYLAWGSWDHLLHTWFNWSTDWLFPLDSWGNLNWPGRVISSYQLVVAVNNFQQNQLNVNNILFNLLINLENEAISYQNNLLFFYWITVTNISRPFHLLFWQLYMSPLLTCSFSAS